VSARSTIDPLASFHPVVRAWFANAFGAPTHPQALGWPAIARRESTLILAPTGSGKTLAAFLSCLDRLMFAPPPPRTRRCRVLYVSPLKALAVDVERNLRAPLAGIARVAEERLELYTAPTIAIRTGDTPQLERARFRREPADILITTPESLYLLLTSQARDALRSIDTIIVDEIHALVPTKRGAHLALSLERLAAICEQPPQRIGLSATQRPLDEVARFLGGAEPRKSRRHTAARSTPADLADEFASNEGRVRYRPVTIVDASQKKPLKLSIEVPLDQNRGHRENPQNPENSENLENPSVWSSIHPRLLELVRTHRSTLIFVNSRRLAERLAGALNELAGETLARSHHGSIAREQRVEVEDLLKAGALRALVATSSLELGIDMGAIDLVVQIEAPPSVASGLQRIGRGGHQANAVSEGVIFPKFRGDLVACAAVARAMHEGAVEATRYPRNPLDIVAQQIVAMASTDAWSTDALFTTIRCAAPFSELGPGAFDGVLDMLSGRYPSDEFAELRPRVTWDRVQGTVTAREGAKRVAVTNGGTIPDRGLYGVFLSGASAPTRVGELDEEMVFESRVGEVFVLGASSWRIDEITHDRVLVSPAPGLPGKMPFWKGDRAGRPLELGLTIGRLMRDLSRMPPAAAAARLTSDHDVDPRAAEHLLQYLRDQIAATGVLPDASTVVIERVRDDLGDWRICVLSPRGGRIHAPWAMAVAAEIRDRTGADVETLWGDDGFVVRYPDVDEPPDPMLFVPDPERVETLVAGQLGGTALFAAKFRENAARSLLLPKRRPGMRAPLWQQRKRAADLLAVAARYGSFPVVLETYRECLRDFFDMPGLVTTLAEVRSRRIHVTTTDARRPSPFAASLLFSYVASFLYDGDAPLAERRAHALAVDQSQLRELIGDAELRELLDAGSMDTVERQLQRLDPDYQAKSADAVHDMLLAIGDLSEEELLARVLTIEAAESIGPLAAAGRILQVDVANDTRVIAVEDAARYRDALGTLLPPGVPDALLEPAQDPLGDLALRYARTHAPFPAADFASRYGLTPGDAEAVLARLVGEGRLIDGEFRPGGTRREWTDPGVLRMLRSRSLSKLRREIEPVGQAVLGRFTTVWQGVRTKRRGRDGLLDAIEQLQGAPVAASLLDREILPARIEQYRPADLDAVTAAGEVVWVGVEPLGDRDGRIALYLADDLTRLLPPRNTPSVRLKPDATSAEGTSGLDARESAVLEYLDARGASFFGPLHDAVGGGYPGETVDALWRLVWQGLVTNDTFHALRAFAEARAPRRKARHRAVAGFRSRRLAPPSAEGRWTLVPGNRLTVTAWSASIAQQILVRHGIVTRESVSAETLPGGFGSVYPALKAMEEAGKLRRGYFVAGLGATQFALPGAVDLLRSLAGPDRVTHDGDRPDVVVLAATDPANPYGATLKWPSRNQAPDTPSHQSKPDSTMSANSTVNANSAGRGPTRTIGATVVLVDGAVTAFLARGDSQLLTFLPDAEPQRSHAARGIAQALIARAREPAAVDHDEARRGMLIEEIDGLAPPSAHPLAPYLIEAGFVDGAMGLRANLQI
jgi:ATP-dependent Lhr-like helicase